MTSCFVTITASKNIELYYGSQKKCWVDNTRYITLVNWSLLGGWTNPSEKYARQFRWFPQFSGWPPQSFHILFHNPYCWMVNFHDPESWWNIIPKLASNAIFIQFSLVSVWGSCCQLIIRHHQFLWCLTRTQLLEVSRDVAFRFAAIDLRQVEQFWRLVEGLNEKDSCNWCDGDMIALMISKKIVL